MTAAIDTQIYITTDNAKKRIHIESSSKKMDASPSNFVKGLFAGRKRIRTSFKPNHKYCPSVELQEAFSNDAVRAVRSNDAKALREILEQGKSLDGCNANGETLLHLACRRSNPEIILFLLREARVPFRTDSLGRSPLHDLCWRSSPEMETLAVFIQTIVPDLLVAEDMRGHICFDYCRKADWDVWINFLHRSTDTLNKRMQIFDSIYTCYKNENIERSESSGMA